MNSWQFFTYRAIGGYVILTLCKYTLRELNAFDASTNNTALANRSSSTVCIACIKHSHTASRTVQTCNNPADVAIASLACVTIISLAIRHNTSPTPTGLSPGFLFNGIKRHARNVSKDDDLFSVVHNFLITSAKVLRKSVVLSPN